MPLHEGGQGSALRTVGGLPPLLLRLLPALRDPWELRRTVLRAVLTPCRRSGILGCPDTAPWGPSSRGVSPASCCSPTPSPTQFPMFCVLCLKHPEWLPWAWLVCACLPTEP